MIWTDNLLIRLFLPIIQNGLIADGFTDVVVQQANQPTQQGIPTAPTLSFYKVDGRRYGFLGRHDEWNADTLQMEHHERQYYETTFRVQSLSLQNVKSPSYTAWDLVDEVASLLQSDQALQTLNGQGVGILRVTEIANNYFVDDRDNFEALAWFEFTLVYLSDRVSTNPIVDDIEPGIYPV